MGKIHKGLPYQLALDLRHKYGLLDFIETGTLVGNSAAWAAKHFDQVFTIEFSKDFYQRAKGRFPNLGISFYLGDSRYELKKILASAKLSLIWLDAHWSRDLDYPRPKFGECPVLEEIAQINQDGRNHVILIDDARYFINPPPKPHRKSEWPSFDLLESVLSSRKKTRIIKIVDDVIVAIPVK